jgi:hypothetical protein
MKTKLAPSAPPNLEEIVALARRQVAQEELVVDLENSLKAQQEILRVIQQEDLPAAMAEAGLQKFTLDSGETIEVKDDFVVGIPKERQEEAYNWLETNGYGSIIKTLVAVEFGRGELGKAQQLADSLAKRKFNCGLARNVHWQTLKAFVVEQTNQTKPIPLDLFGAVPVNKAVVKAPRSKG